MSDEQKLYDDAFRQMGTTPLEPGETQPPRRGGARPKIRPDDGRGGARPKVRNTDKRSANGGARTGKAGRPRGDNKASTVQIGAEHQDMLDCIVAHRRSIQPDATRRGIVEGWISEHYAALDAMWQECAEIINE